MSKNRLPGGGYKPRVADFVLGVDETAISDMIRAQRLSNLRATLNNYLPDFVKSVVAMSKLPDDGDTPRTLGLHQDAFAANYTPDEFTILGMAIKFAGLYGVPVTITGTNRETCGD